MKEKIDLIGDGSGKREEVGGLSCGTILYLSSRLPDDMAHILTRVP